MRRFTKRRNCSTLRGHQSDNLSFKEDGMTRRSMPSSFHANLFALVPARCPSSTCGVAMVVIGAALGDVPFLPAVGDTPLVQGQLKESRSALAARGRDERLLAQDQRREFVLRVHYVVGAGGLQLCAATEAPGDTGALEAGVVTGQNIDIGIAHIECGCRIGA